MRRSIILLVIDDEKPFRDLLKHVLEGYGYQVIAAKDGEDGWSQMELNSPDLVLLDIQMPGMNGWEFLEKTRAEGVDVPILVMSAADADIPSEPLTLEDNLVGEPEVEPRGTSHSLTHDFLPKPFELDDLLATIEARLR